MNSMEYYSKLEYLSSLNSIIIACLYTTDVELNDYKKQLALMRSSMDGHKTQAVAIKATLLEIIIKHRRRAHRYILALDTRSLATHNNRLKMIHITLVLYKLLSDSYDMTLNARILFFIQIFVFKNRTPNS